MTPQNSIENAKRELENAFKSVQEEIRNYPTPIAGCDAQFNYLLGMRSSIKKALEVLDVPQFVPTPRELTPNAVGIAVSDRV